MNANNLTDGMSQPASSMFKVGDRVRTVYGPIVIVDKIDPKRPVYDICGVHTSGTREWFSDIEIVGIAHPMSQQARTVLAAWRASGRTLKRVDRPNSDNRANINHGYATRRYCTPDLSIDLTITTAVQQ